ncbi:Swt1 family HEPN domain-containing protein [Reticulibacter mediterranei]|nr:Swt1 family HEPN domain-containing protein [Reticulibacter mediterranei]
MPLEFKNPFSGFTQIVTGPHFLGRRQDMIKIAGMLVSPEEDEPLSNIAVVGIHRIGKSSLVKHVLKTYEVDLFVKRRVPVWINLKNHRNSLAFFSHLIDAALKEINKAQYLDTASIERLIAYQPDAASFELLFPGNIKKFFTEVENAGIHLLFILEEFDYARVLFAKDEQGFESLRQLSQECGVNYITLSRRTVKHIELQTMAGSTLDSIFAKHYVTPFNDEDLQQYFGLFAQTPIQITSKMKQQILSYCGGHPYLLGMLGCELVAASYQEQQPAIEQILDRIQTSCDHYFDNVIQRLREDQNINSLFQVIFGPKIDITQKDINELRSYGLIKENAAQKSLLGTKLAPAYICFSESFQAYLDDLGREVKLFPLLGETELTLRTLIKKELQKVYKDLWLEDLKKRYPKDFQTYTNIQAKDQDKGKAGTSDNLLDYTYLGMIFDIIFEKYWPIFRPIFQKDLKNKTYWKQRADLIAEVRNPVMHIRIQNITADVRYRCEEYCQEILQAIEEHTALTEK